MSENPFIHPAQLRFQELLNEAEELAMEQTAPRPLHDPFEPYHMAREWGVDPWVMRAIELDTHVAKLRAEAQSFAPDDEGAIQAFKETAVAALQALVLFEEQVDGDQGLDDQQLANFLDKLVVQLDERIERLRQPEVKEFDGTHPHPAFVPPFEDENPSQDPDFPGADDDHTEHVHWVPKIPIRLKDQEEELTPGLAFTGPHGSVVGSEGSDGTPPAGENTGPMLVEDLPPSKDLIRPEEVPADTDAHDFRPPENGRLLSHPGDEPVDLGAAERALAREVVALRREAGGSSAGQVVGRHTSPANTDPDMGETGRRARED